MSSLQWDLLAGSTDETSPSEAGPSRPRELATLLQQADFKAILLSPEAKYVFADSPSLFDEFVDVTGVIQSGSKNVLPEIRLIIAIALLHSYVQANWTGPDLTFTPLELLPGNIPTIPSLEDLNAAALPQLALQGEPAYHLSQHPSLLLLSLRLLSTCTNLITQPWWSLRAHLIHQSLLDEPVDLPRETLDAVIAMKIAIPDGAGKADLRAKLDMEIGLLHHNMGRDKESNRMFLDAARECGLEFELTGALGKKTKFQIDAHTQLVLLAESRVRAGEEKAKEEGDRVEDERSLPTTWALNDDTLLEETEFTKTTTPNMNRLSHLDPASQPPLHPLDQSLLLSMCLAQHNNTPTSGLTASQMMPFVTRVITHPLNWSVHTTALLLRSRLESTRSRTVERSTLQLQALIEQMPTSDSAPLERLRYFHQLPLPSRWEMERELGKRYVSMGVTRSALEIFTRLEMWEDVVGCLQRMEEEKEAERVVRDLLEGKKVESDLVVRLGRTGISERRKTNLESGRAGKLWCLLGDLALSIDTTAHGKEVAKGHYEKAWDVSGMTSSRAMRSLGSLYFTSKEYEQAISCFEKALKISPLYARVWFTMGVSFVRLERWKEARDAFQRGVGVEVDDAEGWNNLAAVFLRLGEEGLEEGQAPPPVSYENKLAASRALRQGLRYGYSNWRMWANYMVVSVDVGELSEASRALTRLVEERATKDGAAVVDVDVLDKLVDSVTRDDYSLLSKGQVVPKSSNEGFGLLPIVERLFDVTILPRVSDSPRIWKCHARLLRWKEDWRGAMEDYLKAYRCGVAQEEKVERELEVWREAVREVEELVGVMEVLGGKIEKAGPAKEDGAKKGDWRFQARGLVRTFIGRTRTAFGEEPEIERLQEVLADLKKSD